MTLSKEEIAQIAKETARAVIEGRVTYHEPETVPQGIQDSLGEEVLAHMWYQLRAKHARGQGDEGTARLYEHIANEELSHYQELSRRRIDVF